jgi:pyridoxal phosphate enzyme (YggS family)
LIAVSKTVAAPLVAEAFAAGQPLFGENYAQELRDKAPLVAGARWHYIGPLQRNKVKYVVGVAELIHSVDSPSLLAAIAQRAEQQKLVQRVLIQVNTGAEAQKSGIQVADLPSLIDETKKLPAISLEGLMCIPPVDQDPAQHFAELDALANQHQLHHRSMGMSADFAVAIRHGATLIRVGTAIFGARH